MIVQSILDTDILSEYLKGHHPTVINHAGRYAQEHGIFTFTSVTLYEIVYGLELKSASNQLKRAGGMAQPERRNYADFRWLSRCRHNQGDGKKKTVLLSNFPTA